MQNRNRKQQQRQQQRFYSCFAIWSTHDRRISYMYIHLAFNEANRKECKCLFGMETATKIEKERRKEYKWNKNLYEISTWMLKQSAIINAFSWLVSLSKREYIGIKPSTMKIKANICSLRNAKNNETKAKLTQHWAASPTREEFAWQENDGDDNNNSSNSRRFMAVQQTNSKIIIRNGWKWAAIECIIKMNKCIDGRQAHTMFEASPCEEANHQDPLKYAKNDSNITTIGSAVLYMGNCESGSILCESDIIYQHLERTTKRTNDRTTAHTRVYLALLSSLDHLCGGWFCFSFPMAY